MKIKINDKNCYEPDLLVGTLRIVLYYTCYHRYLLYYLLGTMGSLIILTRSVVSISSSLLLHGLNLTFLEKKKTNCFENMYLVLFWCLAVRLNLKSTFKKFHPCMVCKVGG